MAYVGTCPILACCKVAFVPTSWSKKVEYAIHVFVIDMLRVTQAVDIIFYHAE